jgi:hypothetical protein
MEICTRMSSREQGAGECGEWDLGGMQRGTGFLSSIQRGKTILNTAV